MIDIQKQFSEQLGQFTQYQKDAVEKLQAKTAAGVDGWEKFARYNLAVMNDVAFAKVVEGRTKEYIDLLSAAASTATEELQEATKENVVKAVKKSA
jgi:hypothetical protein